MNQKKSPQTLKSILQTLTSVFLNWLNLFWQTIRGFVFFIKRRITKFKRKLRSTKVKNQKINTSFSLQEKGQCGKIKKQIPTLYQYLKLFTPKFRFKSWFKSWQRTKLILLLILSLIITLQFSEIRGSTAQAITTIKSEHSVTHRYINFDNTHTCVVLYS